MAEFLVSHQNVTHSLERNFLSAPTTKKKNYEAHLSRQIKRNHFSATSRHFMKYGYKDLYKYIFGSPQFPFGFVIQATYSSILQLTVVYIEEKIFSHVTNYFSFLDDFRSKRNYCLYDRTALSHAAYSTINTKYFFAIYVILNIPIIFNFVQVFFRFLGMAQGANEARLLKLFLRSFQHLPLRLSLHYALF